MLNLFAYTGGSTLAAAAAGAEVVHVDAARNIVAWARRNAERSGLAEAPIRWIAEDAMKFVKRELAAAIATTRSYSTRPATATARTARSGGWPASAAGCWIVRPVDRPAAAVHAVDLPHARFDAARLARMMVEPWKALRRSRHDGSRPGR